MFNLHSQFRGLGHLGGGFGGTPVPWFGVIAFHGQSGGLGHLGRGFWGCLSPLVWGDQHPGSVCGAGVGGLGHQVVGFGVPQSLGLGLSPSTVNLWVWDTWVVGIGVPQSLSLGLSPSMVSLWVWDTWVVAFGGA